MFYTSEKNPFLRKNEALKLQLLNHLLEKETLLLIEIEEHFKISSRKAKRLSQELKNECWQINNELDIYFTGQVLYFGRAFESSIYLSVFSELISQYHKSSILYQLVILLSKFNEISNFNLSSDLNISQSYLYESIRKLNSIFESLNLCIHVNTYKNTVSLKGNEVHIRIFYYYLNVLTLDYDTTPNLDNKSNVAQCNKFLILRNIFIIRNKHFKKLPTLDPEIIYIIKLIQTEKRLPLIHVLDENEQYAMKFWLLYVSPNLINNSQKNFFGKKLWYSNLSNILHFKNIIHDLLNDKIITSDMVYSTLFDYVFRFYIFKYFDYATFKKISHKKILSDARYNNLSLILKKNLQPLFNNTFCPTYFIKELNYELAEITYNNFFEKKTISINFQIIEYSEIELFIENTIKKVYSDKILIISDSIDEADLIITNINQIAQTYKNIYYFNDIHSKTTWIELHKRIGELLFSN